MVVVVVAAHKIIGSALFSVVAMLNPSFSFFFFQFPFFVFPCLFLIHDIPPLCQQQAAFTAFWFFCFKVFAWHGYGGSASEVVG
jgi:hypothetical protein